MKIFVFLAVIAAVSATPYLRTRRESEGHPAEERHGTEYHHDFEHEHAKSHQSIKFHHFHPVPVYVKKEHLHLLKDPLEKGKSSHGVKQIHPKFEQQHGYGLVLEHHNYNTALHHGRSNDEEFGHLGEAELKLSEGNNWEAAAEHVPVYENHQELEHQPQAEQYQGFSGYSEHEAAPESLEGY